MISLLLGLGLTLGAGPEWTEARIENLAVSSVNPLLGRPVLNARQIDMNQDGYVDLVFSDRVVLQKSGSFDESDAVALPRIEEGPAIDFYNQTLFLRFNDGLQSFALVEGVWETRLDMEIVWAHERRPAPPAETENEEAPPTEVRQPRFEQYVYDIDGDGFPELLFPLQDGLHVYRLEEGRFLEAGVLNVFPSARLIPLESLEEATGVTRSITFPDQYARFRCVIEAPRIQIVTEHRAGDDETRFEWMSYTVSRMENSFAATANEGGPVSSGVLAAGMQPVRVGNDGDVVYAGASLDYASTLAILTPIFTTRVQGPGGEEAVYRSKSFTPHTIFADVNRDGLQDLIQETTHIADGGIRETLMRFTTQKTFQHEVGVYLGLGGGEFEEEASISKTLRMKLDQTPIRLSTMFQRYQAGKLVNLTGDFNGDGHCDLLAQTTPEELSLFLFDGAEFGDEPAAVIPIEDYETFHVVDINGDRVADVLFQGTPLDEIQTRQPARALLFRAGGAR